MDLVALGDTLIIVLFLALCGYTSSSLKRHDRLPRVKRFGMTVFLLGAVVAAAPRLAATFSCIPEPDESFLGPLASILGAAAIAGLANELLLLNKEYAAVREGLAAAQAESDQVGAT